VSVRTPGVQQATGDDVYVGMVVEDVFTYFTQDAVMHIADMAFNIYYNQLSVETVKGCII